MEKMNEASLLVVSLGGGACIEGPTEVVRTLVRKLETGHGPMTQEALARAMREVLAPLVEASKMGKVIQYRHRQSGAWSDCVHRKESTLDFDLARFECRVEPEPREAWVRLDGPAPAIYLDDDMDEATAHGLGYVRMREVGRE